MVVARTEQINRADMLADVVESMLRGSRVLVVGETGDDARKVFGTIADAFTGDDGKPLSGVTVRTSKGAERIDLPGNNGRLWIASARNAGTRARGMVVDRVYSPAGLPAAVHRSYEAAAATAADPVVLEYSDEAPAR